VLFFDGVVRAEMRAELETRGDELFEGEVGRSFVVEAGVVEHCPGLAEVVVLIFISLVLFSSHSLYGCGNTNSRLDENEKRTYEILHMLRHRIVRSEFRGA